MTGQQEVGLLRLTGQKLHLQLLTETSKPMLVFGPRSHPVSPCPPIPCRPVNGRIKLLMQLKGTESDGCNRSTWFTTIAMTLNVSLKVSQPNASDQGSSREAKLAYIFNC